jgi:2,7-dihydroxy-5-methyl-1-naphthoate 7-O-methyltransferase
MPAQRLRRAFAVARTPAGRSQLVRRGISRLEAELHERAVTPAGPVQSLHNATGLRTLVTLQAVRAFATLGLADLIAAGVTDPGDLAERVDADADAIARLLRHLTERGILEREPSGAIRLNAMGELLRKGHPDGQDVYFNTAAISPRYELALTGLLYSIRTGRSAYARMNGAEIWEQMAAEPAMVESFDMDMADHSLEIGPGLSDGYDWSGIAEVADVGGGTGDLLRYILLRHQGLRGVVIEYADAVIRARERLDAAGLSDRCQVIQADFFKDDLPPNADVYMLSWILHDWDDAAARTILERCRDAAGKHGRILVVEKPYELAHDSDLDLRMLVFFGGRERTTEELEALAERAALKVTSWTDIGSGFRAMECYPV